MTTSKAKKPTPVPMGITLATFCEQIDAYLGEDTGVLQAIQDYRTASDTLTVVGTKSAARLAVNAQLDKFIGFGDVVVHGKRLRAVVRGGGARVSLRSDVVAKARPALWEASRVAVPVLGVKTSGGVTVPAPMIGSMMFARDAWAALEQLRRRNTEANRVAAEAREKLREVFFSVTDVWDGADQLTTDGWVLGWGDQLRFNEARCRELALEQSVDLAPLESVGTVAGRRVYELVDADGPDSGADGGAE